MEILYSLKPGLLWVLCGLLGAAALQPRRPTSARHLLSVVLGPIGLLFLVSLRQNEHRYCPACDERMSTRLDACPHCGHEAPELTAAPGELNAFNG